MISLKTDGQQKRFLIIKHSKKLAGAITPGTENYFSALSRRRKERFLGYNLNIFRGRITPYQTNKLAPSEIASRSTA